MKLIKSFLLMAIVAMVAISCGETKKEATETAEDAVEAVAEAGEATAEAVGEAADATAEAGADAVRRLEEFEGWMKQEWQDRLLCGGMP